MKSRKLNYSNNRNDFSKEFLELQGFNKKYKFLMNN